MAGTTIHTVQAVARYFPDPAKVAGIQVNMREVSLAMRPLGISSTIVASIDGTTAARTTDHGMTVLRYPVGDDVPLEPNHGPDRHYRFDVFRRWMHELKPDLYHQHQWTPKCGYQHLRVARRMGIPTVVSVHVPLPLCARQTLMRNGTTACDGRIDVAGCVRCLGHPRRDEPADTDQHVLQSHIQQRIHGLELMAANADVLVVSADWLRTALIVNGVPAEKIELCRQGVATPAATAATPVPASGRSPLRLGFFGRWTPMKGIDTVIDALTLVANPDDFELHVYGIPQEPDYERSIRRIAATMPSVVVHDPAATSDVHDLMAGMDVVVVPSRWLETGPLVVMQAFAAGRPVVGSDLGGIAERVRHRVDGLLVAADDPAAWAGAFEELRADKALVSLLASAVEAPRSVDEQARALAGIYRDLLRA